MRTEKLLDSKFRTNEKKYFFVLCRTGTVGEGNWWPPPEISNRDRFSFFLFKEQHDFMAHDKYAVCGLAKERI